MINTYEPNNKTLNYMKQKPIELSKEMEKVTIKIKSPYPSPQKLTEQVGRKSGKI